MLEPSFFLKTSAVVGTGREEVGTKSTIEYAAEARPLIAGQIFVDILVLVETLRTTGVALGWQLFVEKLIAAGGYCDSMMAYLPRRDFLLRLGASPPCAR